jgi:hypothetical protein
MLWSEWSPGWQFDEATFAQSAVAFPGFFCDRLSCRAATRSITFLRASLGGGALRFCPFALSSISFLTSPVYWLGGVVFASGGVSIANTHRKPMNPPR